MSQSLAAVHIVQRMALGGIETFVLDLARQPDSGIAIISLEGTCRELTERWPALQAVSSQLVALSAGSGFKPELILELRRILRAKRARAVVVHHIGPLLYGGIAARLAGVRRVIHVEHDTWHYTAEPRHRTMMRFLEAMVRPRHICQSRTTARTLSQILPGARINIVPAGIDLGRFKPGNKAAARERLGLDPAAALVGSIGRLAAVKGHMFLVGALRYLPERVSLAIAGDGPERPALEAKALSLGLSGRVHFLGHRDDIPDILPAFDLFCLPSLNEGVPRSVLEAQACDVPVVATSVGAVREAVCPATGFLVEPSNEIRLAAAIQRILTLPLAVSPRCFVEAHYSWPETLNSYRHMAEV